jgi:hypothetical protein
MPPPPLFTTITLFARLDNDAMLLTVNTLRVARALLWLRIHNPQFEHQFRGTPHIHFLLQCTYLPLHPCSQWISSQAIDIVDGSVDTQTTALLQDAFSFHTCASFLLHFRSSSLTFSRYSHLYSPALSANIYIHLYQVSLIQQPLFFISSANLFYINNDPALSSAESTVLQLKLSTPFPWVASSFRPHLNRISPLSLTPSKSR